MNKLCDSRTGLAGLAALALGGLHTTALAGIGGTVDENPPECECFSKGGASVASRYDSFDQFDDNFVLCEAFDDRPSEDQNLNGILDPGEDLNGNGLIDEDTGIFSIELAPGSINMELRVFGLTPGDPFAFFDLFTIDFGQPATATVIVTDGAGNTCEPAIQLEEFEPGGGIGVTPTTPITIPISLPSPDIVSVQCVDVGDDGPQPSDFDGEPFVPFDQDPVPVDVDLLEPGLRDVCCQFMDALENVSPPLCTTAEFEPGDLQPPGDLTGRPKPGKVDLLWSGVDGAESYNVYRSTNGSDFIVIGDTDRTIFVDFSVQAGQTYFFAVTSVANGVESEPSEIFEVFIPFFRVPPFVTLPRATP